MPPGLVARDPHNMATRVRGLDASSTKGDTWDEGKQITILLGRP